MAVPASRRSGGRALLAAAACGCLLLLASSAFVPAPRHTPTSSEVNLAVAATAGLPVLLAAGDAEAVYGERAHRWNAVLVPLTTLILPGIAFAGFFLYSFQEDAFWQLIPGSKRSIEIQKKWRSIPEFANIRDPLDGLIDRDDWERGLEEAWEKAKPAGSKITVKEKLKDLATQNAPHSLAAKAIYRPPSA
eukprot:TRINITY_DN2279_c0_g1_i1.p1 TRINITY_DN2279_c0_g1~~TRINITY_DN2279_c0_g1_i1.p1  ORF type:complete len:191 (-),score=54.13 TRINITY_DN2279_c0_g1_i1:146-718(-)